MNPNELCYPKTLNAMNLTSILSTIWNSTLSANQKLQTIFYWKQTSPYFFLTHFSLVVIIKHFFFFCTRYIQNTWTIKYKMFQYLTYFLEMNLKHKHLTSFLKKNIRFCLSIPLECKCVLFPVLPFKTDFILQSWINGSEYNLMNELFWKHLSPHYLKPSPILINLSIIYALYWDLQRLNANAKISFLHCLP